MSQSTVEFVSFFVLGAYLCRPTPSGSTETRDTIPTTSLEYPF